MYLRSLMAQWLGRASQGHEMLAMGSNPVGSNMGCVVLLPKSHLNQKCHAFSGGSVSLRYMS